MNYKDDLTTIYQALLDEFGNQNWWPSDSPFETIIGAILTQSVAWVNVRKAISNLKSAGLMEPQKLYEAETNDIAAFIIPSRYYNQKARRIKNFIKYYWENYNADLNIMASGDTAVLRNELLGINGFGEETVDSILLYACKKPIFVVDAYTKRIFSRCGLIDYDAKYGQIQDFFMGNLSEDEALFNDYHAQIVNLGNMICKNKPLCEKCPLSKPDSNFICKYHKGQF